MPSLTDRAWSPYVAGIVIGLLQVPAFLIIETALGASSSYVTVGGLLGLVDGSINCPHRLCRTPCRHHCQELVAGCAGGWNSHRRVAVDEALRR